MELVTRKSHKTRNYYHIVAEDGSIFDNLDKGNDDLNDNSGGSDAHHMRHPAPQGWEDHVYPPEGYEIHSPYLDETADTMIKLEFTYFGLFLLMIGIAIAGQSGFVNLNLTGRLYNFKSLGFVTFMMLIAMLMPAFCCFKATEQYSRENDLRYDEDRNDMEDWKLPGNESYFNANYTFQEDGNYNSMLNTMMGLLVFPILCIVCPIFMIGCDKMIGKAFNQVCGGLVGDIAKDQLVPSKEKSMASKGLEFASNPSGVMETIGGIGKEIGKALEGMLGPDDTPNDPYNTTAEKKSNPVYNRPINAVTDNYQFSDDDSDTPLINYVKEENKKSSQENNNAKEKKDDLPNK